MRNDIDTDRPTSTREWIKRTADDLGIDEDNLLDFLHFPNALFIRCSLSVEVHPRS